MIYIIQCLCEQRHAIYAVAYDPEITPHDLAMAMIQQQVEEWIAKKTIHPWCGICESRVWIFEAAWTKFKTMEEAMGELKTLESENIISRMIIDWRKTEKN